MEFLTFSVRKIIAYRARAQGQFVTNIGDKFTSFGPLDRICQAVPVGRALRMKWFVPEQRPDLSAATRR